MNFINQIPLEEIGTRSALLFPKRLFLLSNKKLSRNKNIFLKVFETNFFFDTLFLSK